MNCTATTRLTAEECLARLDALRPMPVGERMAASIRGETEGRHYWALVYRSFINDMLELWWTNSPHEDGGDTIDYVARSLLEHYACVRRLREERRALREALADVIGPPCEKFGRYCLTHQNKECRADEARKLLGWEP